MIPLDGACGEGVMQICAAKQRHHDDAFLHRVDFRLHLRGVDGLTAPAFGNYTIRCCVFFVHLPSGAAALRAVLDLTVLLPVPAARSPSSSHLNPTLTFRDEPFSVEYLCP